MRYLLIGVWLSAGAFACTSSPKEKPPPSPREVSAAERVVLAQVDAYNRHDIDAFVDTYATDAALYVFPDTLLSRGQDSLRSQYAGLFANMPNLHAVVSGRLVIGNRVLLEERVTGIPGMDTLKSVVIYEVRDGKISRAWFLQ